MNIEENRRLHVTAMEADINGDQLSPEDYAKAIDVHSKQTARTSLYPGQNFEDLAHYLQSVIQKRKSCHPSPVAVAFIYTLTASAPERLKILGNVHEVHASPQRDRSSSSEANSETSLLFLRGRLSAEWIAHIGSWYHVDPEFWQRHMNFRSAFRQPDYFQLPSLPSSSSNIIHLRLVTVGSWETGGKYLDQAGLDELRAEGARAMDEYHRHLRAGTFIKDGSSVVRRFSVHTDKYFSIEQDVSICASKIGRGWAVIIWLDVGEDLNEGPTGPWLYLGARRNTKTTRLYPTIQHQPRIALLSQKVADNSSDQFDPSAQFAQSAARLHLDYGRSLNRDLMCRDPFYAVTELFTFAAFAESQFLNMIEANLSAETSWRNSTDDNFSLSNLLHSKNLLDDHSQRLRANIITIRERGGLKWPKAQEADLREKADVTVRQLLQDFEFLLERARELSAHCERGMNIVMNNSMIAESKRAISQARVVAKLTRLAFFFIPLSFTTSFLGMNVSQFGTGKLNIWVWFVLSIPVFTASVIFLVFDISGLARRYLRFDKLVQLVH